MNFLLSTCPDCGGKMHFRRVFADHSEIYYICGHRATMDHCDKLYVNPELSTLRAKLAEVEKERDAIRVCFAEASQLAGPAFVAHEELASAKARIAELEATIQFAFDEIDNRYDGAADSKTLWLSHTLDRLHTALAKKAI